MEWYLPITIMPAIGLIILSTTNFIIALNNEIYELNLVVIFISSYLFLFLTLPLLMRFLYFSLLGGFSLLLWLVSVSAGSILIS